MPETSESPIPWEFQGRSGARCAFRSSVLEPSRSMRLSPYTRSLSALMLVGASGCGSDLVAGSESTTADSPEASAVTTSDSLARIFKPASRILDDLEG